MKLRDPNAIRRVAAAIAVVARGWYRTLSFAYRPLTAYLMNDRPDLIGSARYIYAFWHEYLFVPSYVYARPDTAVLIGLHRDGELLTHINERFGFPPDGPKGPRRKCQPGAVYLASRTGLAIVPVGFGYSRCWRANNWDRF